MFGVKSLLMDEKVLLMRKNLVAIVSCAQTGVWCDKCSNKFGRYIEQ